MVKKSFLGLIALVFTVSYSPSVFSEEASSFNEGSYESSTTTISKGKYWAGGVVSLIGFGAGHAVQGRYKERGWIFTAAEVVAIGGWLTFSVLTAKDAVETKTFSFGKGGLALAFSLAFGGIKIWEVVDAFVLPDHYKVVKASPFQISPLVLWNNNSTDDVDWGLSLKYKF